MLKPAQKFAPLFSVVAQQCAVRSIPAKAGAPGRTAALEGKARRCTTKRVSARRRGSGRDVLSSGSRDKVHLLEDVEGQLLADLALV